MIPVALATDQEAVPDALPTDRDLRFAGRRWSAVSGVVVALIAVVVAIVAVTHEHQHQAPVRGVALDRPQLRFGFETPSDRWGILWGQQHAVGTVSDAMHYEGQHSYQVTVTGASTTRGYVAFGTTHGLETLHSAMRAEPSMCAAVESPAVAASVHQGIANARPLHLIQVGHAGRCGVVAVGM